MPGPSVVILGGPNGAGKSTAAPALLRDTLGVSEFVNADTIAQGLAAFDPDSAALAAGRVMLARLRELAAQRVSFAFETTLASRSFAPWLAELARSRYALHLVFLWLPSAEMAVQRVADRVALGGHDVPPETVRRRYQAGLRNLVSLYLPIVTTWRIYDNSAEGAPRVIASGAAGMPPDIRDLTAWTTIRSTALADD